QPRALLPAFTELRPAAKRLCAPVGGAHRRLAGRVRADGTGAALRGGAVAVAHVEGDRRSESTAELVKDLSREVSELVRQEIALAKAEMTQKGKKAGAGAGMLSGAAVLGLAAVGGSMATLILLLDLVMPAWLAAL